MTHSTRLLLLSLMLFIAQGCATVSGSNRTQLNMFTVSADASIGAEAWAEVMKDPKRLKSGPAVKRVERVGSRIVAAAKRRHPKIASSFDWEFAVIDDPKQVNAFALPGGKFAVYTGMLAFTQGDDDMLAAVLGHEAAHVTSRHGTERLTQVSFTNIGLGLTNVFVLGDLPDGDRNRALEAIGVGANIGILLPFSRSHESEADELGIFIAADADYNPQAAVKLWRKMGKRGGDVPPEFLSTHPAYTTRIERLQQAMPKARAIRANSSG